METIADLREARVEARCLIIQGTIDDEMVEAFQGQVDAAYEHLPQAELIIELNTPGGDMDCMNILFSEIATLAANGNVWILGRGLVASAGIYLLGAVPRERRVALPYTKFFHHPATFNVTGLHANLNKKVRKRFKRERRAYIRSYSQEIDRRIEQLVESMTIDVEAFNKLEAAPSYLTETEAENIGLISHVLT